MTTNPKTENRHTRPCDEVMNMIRVLRERAAASGGVRNMPVANAVNLIRSHLRSGSFKKFECAALRRVLKRFDHNPLGGRAPWRTELEMKHLALVAMRQVMGTRKLRFMSRRLSPGVCTDMIRNVWADVGFQLNGSHWMGDVSGRFRFGPRSEIRRLVFCTLYNMFYQSVPYPCQQAPAGRYVGKPLHETLPLYACSGEMEFVRMTQACEESPVYHRRRSFWDLGRDGGGQHELRFQIGGRLPEVASKIVRRIGPIARNGGHIHLNCQMDPEIGNRVYAAFITHLTWFRFLAPSVRRTNRFCSVRETRLTLSEATLVKFAAVSANTWNRTGTVEVRLWPSTKSAATWRNRARFMQSLARWSEDRVWLTPARIDGCGTEALAGYFKDWAGWAAENDLPSLRWVARELLDRARPDRRDAAARRIAQHLVPLIPSSALPRRRTVVRSQPQPEEKGVPSTPLRIDTTVPVSPIRLRGPYFSVRWTPVTEPN